MSLSSTTPLQRRTASHARQQQVVHAPQAAGTQEPASRAPFVLDENVIRHVEPMLKAFAYRAVWREDVAYDLVQETYIAALEHSATFEGRSQLRTWLVGILARKIADYFRKTKREVMTDTPPEPELPSKLAPTAPASPDSRLDRRRALEVVEGSLQELSELERLAVLLCDVEQQERAAACEAIGVKPTHLRVLLHRGRHKLRRALEDAQMDGT